MPAGDLIHFVIGIVVGLLMKWAIDLGIAIWRECPKPKRPLVKTKGQGRD